MGGLANETQVKVEVNEDEFAVYGEIGAVKQDDARLLIQVLAVSVEGSLVEEAIQACQDLQKIVVCRVELSPIGEVTEIHQLTRLQQFIYVLCREPSTLKKKCWQRSLNVFMKTNLYKKEVDM